MAVLVHFSDLLNFGDSCIFPGQIHTVKTRGYIYTVKVYHVHTSLELPPKGVQKGVIRVYV